MIQALYFGAAASFVGALPPGLIGLNVIETTTQKSIRLGLWLALGAVVVEIIQVALCFLIITLLPHEKEMVQTVLTYTGITILIVLGTWYFFKQSSNLLAQLKSEHDPNSESKIRMKKYGINNNAFVKGAFFSSLNTLVYPFWLFYIGYGLSNHIISTQLSTATVFILSAGLGTMMAMLLFAFLAKNYFSKIKNLNLYLNKAVALILWAIAGIAILRILLN
ncbi:MAG TPA: LysE family transporter [Chitinophagales bacterium]|mgnify:CR=1 FL=1|nr:LysE family transporter [Chitinophagales bacterium]